MAAAIEAAAPSEVDVKEGPRSDSFGRAGSVVLGEIVAARASSGGLGGLGALGGTSQLSAGWFSFSSSRGSGAAIKSVSAEPSFDVFVANGVSLGAIIGGGVMSWDPEGSLSSHERWHVTAMPRIGEKIELAKDIAIWPRFAAGVTLSDGSGQDRMGTALRATFDVPFVFRLARHVALQAGPVLSYFNQLAGPPDVRGFSGGASAGLSIVL